MGVVDPDDRVARASEPPARAPALPAPAPAAAPAPGRAVRPSRRGGNTRASQALELVRKKPGITIPEIAKAMKIEPNYLYRVLPRLASDGQVKRNGQGWHPARATTSTHAASARNVRARRQTRTAETKATPSRRRGARAGRGGQTTSGSNGRTAPGATKASVLAALAGGDAMTAGQVATKAGLARPTVSTTLSKLAKTGEVQKAERGYRLISVS